MTDDDEPGPTRSVRMLRPLPSRPAVPPATPATPGRPRPAQRLGEARKACISASGDRYGPYIMLGEVGKGGMAEVRLAIEELATGGLRVCVIKRVRPGAEPEMFEALRDEAQLLEKLRHPGIVELYRACELEGTYHLACELVDGVSLRQLLSFVAPEPIPARVVLELGVEVARALAFAHAPPLSVVHRDVTPQNVLIARGGRVKLVDFGIARYADRPARTKPGKFKGKLGYIAPEQIDARAGVVSGKTDVFTLGLVLTELLTGQRVLPQKVMRVAETEALIREQCAQANVVAPLALIDLLAAMTRPLAHARPEMLKVATELALLLPEVRGPSAGDYVYQRALVKLLPLDLEAIFGQPTRPVAKLIDAGDDDAYSGTIELLTAARVSKNF